MPKYAVLALVVVFGAGASAPALAQRLPFERSFEVSAPPILDVSTIRGKIDVSVGEPGRIVVTGAVTVRVSWDVPGNAAELARKIADRPPIERDGVTIRLSAPTDAAERRAVTVNYEVKVPAGTEVRTVSDSGATTVRGVSGPVNVRTQSAAIELARLGGTATVTTGSGAVSVEGVAGSLSVTTSSSAFTGRSLRGGVRVRTSSGAITAAVEGTGDLDIESGSSAIRLSGIRGALIAATRSGRIMVDGAPTRPWDVSTGSGTVEIALDSGAGFDVEATSRSGSVKVDGDRVDGTVSKGSVIGTVGTGGPLLRVSSRSGSIRLTVGGGP
jgi:DUF4097 and DUF4098 domain-containing protein YvlB